MNNELSGLMTKKEKYEQDLNYVGKFLQISRNELNLSIEDVVLITQVPAKWIEMAENGQDIPRFARDILVTFFDYVVSYNHLVAHKNNVA